MVNIQNRLKKQIYVPNNADKNKIDKVVDYLADTYEKKGRTYVFKCRYLTKKLGLTSREVDRVIRKLRDAGVVNIRAKTQRGTTYEYKG